MTGLKFRYRTKDANGTEEEIEVEGDAAVVTAVMLSVKEVKGEYCLLREYPPGTG